MSEWLLCQADARRLPLADNSVSMCVTSPPYYGLRDYQTGRWEGGSEACDHLMPPDGIRNVGRNRAASGGMFHDSPIPNQVSRQFRDTCRKCGARRVDRQLGLEASPSEYCAAMVRVFREVKRVLHPSGTVWLNLADSFASGTISANPLDGLASLIKGHVIFLGAACTLRIATKGHKVLGANQPFPDHEFTTLLGVQRVFLKQRNNHLCKILDSFQPIQELRILRSIRFDVSDCTNSEIILDANDDIGIVITLANLDANPPLGVSKVAPRTAQYRQASLAIEESAEPISESIGYTEATRDSIAFHAKGKCRLDVDLVDDPISLKDCSRASSEGLANLVVRKASQEHLAFSLEGEGVSLAIHCVSHLFFSNKFGSLAHYSELYAKAIRKSNALQPKQQLGIPDMLKRALMEDGWICRDTIIWAKSEVDEDDNLEGSAMPGSQRDRCTSAYELIFMLSKRARYFYDPEACKTKSGAMLRNVWRINPEPTKHKHYATYPRELVRRCVLLGSSSRGVCPECLAPWERVVERGEKHTTNWGVNRCQDDYEVGPMNRGGHSQRANGGQIFSYERSTIGFRPTCTHGHDSIPALILDPFCGSATTGVVATALGRRFIGLDLSREYLTDQAMRRLERPHAAPVRPAREEYFPLFDGAAP